MAIGSDLSRANLSGANLRNAGFCIATLNGTNLSAANLTNVCFSSAKLVGANLSEANVSGADFANADLAGANLTGVDFSTVKRWSSSASPHFAGATCPNGIVFGSPGANCPS